MKRRGRFARFSGATSKVVTKVVDRIEVEGEDKVRLKTVEIYVGPKSLSKQVINTGRGPNHERMQEYYNRVSAESKLTTLMEDLGIKHSKYEQVCRETPKTNRINLVNNELGRLDLYWHETRWFFVDIDHRKKLIRRSEDYPTNKIAKRRLQRNLIEWVEYLPIE